jgi:hypothetical protein
MAGRRNSGWFSASRGAFRSALRLFYSDLQPARVFERGPFFSVANWYATNGTKQYAAFRQLEYDLPTGMTLVGRSLVDNANGRAALPYRSSCSCSTKDVGYAPIG